MARIGLTDTQAETLAKSQIKPTLTDLQREERDRLQKIVDNPELPQTAKSYLREWYAADDESLYSKEVGKGNAVESDAIQFACDILELGIATKNTERKSDNYMEGECDVDAEIIDAVIDLKSPWNNRTFQSNVDGMNGDYAMQGKGYCHLWKRSRFILFYALMDTPEDVNYGVEVTYSNKPNEERWLAYEVAADPVFIAEVIERVKLCRIWLAEYDKLIRSKLGKITIIK